MKRLASICALVLTALALGAPPARAQDRLDLSSALEINVHGGGIRLDAYERYEGTAGASALYHLGSSVSLGASADWTRTTSLHRDIDTWYFSGDLVYGLPSATQGRFYALIGAGAARTSVERSDTTTDPMVPVGLGVRWVNRMSHPRWGATIELRDHIIYRSDGDTQVSNDWSLTGGFSLLVGGS